MDSSPLDHLVGAYLNQDVFDFYPDVMAGVDDFRSDEPDLAAPLALEIDQILATHSDVEIDALLRDYGIGFVPGDLGYRGWLVKIAERVRATT